MAYLLYVPIWRHCHEKWRQSSALHFLHVNVAPKSLHFVEIYWAKVLPEQWELIQIFRKHEIFRKNLRMHFEQAINHLSKSLNCILIKCLKITQFFNVLEVPTQNVRLQK